MSSALQYIAGTDLSPTGGFRDPAAWSQIQSPVVRFSLDWSNLDQKYVGDAVLEFRKVMEDIDADLAFFNFLEVAPAQADVHFTFGNSSSVSDPVLQYSGTIDTRFAGLNVDRIVGATVELPNPADLELRGFDTSPAYKEGSYEQYMFFHQVGHVLGLRDSWDDTTPPTKLFGNADITDTVMSIFEGGDQPYPYDYDTFVYPTAGLSEMDQKALFTLGYAAKPGDVVIERSFNGSYHTYETDAASPGNEASIHVDAGTAHVWVFEQTQSDATLFTADAAEARSIRDNLGYLYTPVEGFTYDPNGDDAVHRFYNTTAQSHFFTNDDAEATFIQNNMPSFVYEGIEFYA